MKTVLCFGDSNTYGYRPDNKQRYSSDVRWTGILKSLLSKNDIDLIEEGLVGRTTVFEDSLRAGRKGSDFIVPILETHAPIDELVIMLGTNDCKTVYNASAKVIGLGIENLIKKVRAYNPNQKILLISPIHLGDEVWKDEFDPEFNKNSVQVSKELKDEYAKIAIKYNCRFLAASDVASPSPIDQEHLDENGHAALAKKIYELEKAS